MEGFLCCEFRGPIFGGAYFLNFTVGSLFIVSSSKEFHEQIWFLM